MNDRQMLDRCLKAFEAIRGGAGEARKFVASMSLVTEPYSGTGIQILSNDMVLQLCKHLNTPQDDGLDHGLDGHWTT